MDLKAFKPLIKGVITYIPGLSRMLPMKGSGGTISARYCYSVWLRHLVMLHKNGLPTDPKIIAELGPGDSLGIGLAAMLTGSVLYRAFDVIEYANNRKNLEIFDELASMFSGHERIPDEREFPSVRPLLDSYEFPGHILTNERLRSALDPGRLDAIRKAVLSNGREVQGMQILYVAPWNDETRIMDNSVDMVFSQAVLEHVNDLRDTYNILHRWLRPGGVMSHVIDFSCHNLAREWNGHWAYSDLVWKLIVGKRPYLLNRHPHSCHIQYIGKCGFQIVCDMPYRDKPGINRKDLALRFRDLGDDDLATDAAFIQAVKSGKR